MLNTTLVYEHVVTKYGKKGTNYNVELARDEDADRPPKSNNWEQVKYLIAFLRFFIM